MRRTVIKAALLSGLLAGMPAQAQPGTEPVVESAAAQEVAQDLARATAESQTRRMYDQQRALVEALGLPPALSGPVNTYLAQVQGVMRAELSDPAMQRELMHLFAEHFTLDEMQDLQKFFRSHTGQKFLEKMPALAGDAGILAERRASAMLPQLDSFTRQLLEKVQQYYSGTNE